MCLACETANCPGCQVMHDLLTRSASWTGSSECAVCLTYDSDQLHTDACGGSMSRVASRGSQLPMSHAPQQHTYSNQGKSASACLLILSATQQLSKKAPGPMTSSCCCRDGDGGRRSGRLAALFWSVGNNTRACPSVMVRAGFVEASGTLLTVSMCVAWLMGCMCCRWLTAECPVSRAPWLRIVGHIWPEAEQA